MNDDSFDEEGYWPSLTFKKVPFETKKTCRYNFQIVTHQQRIFMILNSLGIECEPVDIAAPGMDEARDYMREKGKKKDGQRNVLPPQIFNGEKYCGVRKHSKGFALVFILTLVFICLFLPRFSSYYFK